MPPLHPRVPAILRARLCSTVALSQPEAASARSSVSVTSSARMLVHSFQAMM